MSLITRRSVLRLGGTALGLSLLGSRSIAAETRPLPLPQLRDLTDDRFERVAMTIRQGLHDFGNGAGSATFGIDNSYLGPVLKVRSGQTIPFSVDNQLGEETTLHWHGLHVPGNVDGGPHQVILPQGNWQPNVPIRQRASLNWFHAHTHGQTAPQVYKGVAGVLIVEDDDSIAADLPRTYGVDDFVLVIQDKTFDASGRLIYQLTDRMQETGLMGTDFVVNGALAGTVASVPPGWIRLRLLNAANARQIGIGCGDGSTLLVIASDGGFLDKPVETKGIVLMPGERYEVLIDCSNRAQIELIGLTAADTDENGVEFATLVANRAPDLVEHQLVVFAVDTRLPAFTGSQPQTLANLSPVIVPASTRVREFQMNMRLSGSGQHDGHANMMGINKMPMAMDVINENVVRNETELWRLTAEWERHPFHVHGCSFRIVTQNGAPPLDYQRGWKDMVMIEGEEASEILVRFDHSADRDNPYMYHCHTLEHEDMGMMGQFTVT